MTTQLEGEIRPLDLRTYSGPLYVKNLTRNLISYDDGKNVMTLGPTQSEESLAVLPLEVAQNPGFQKLWRRGEVLVTTDPEMEEALRLAQTRTPADVQANPAGGVMEQTPQSKDLIPATCLNCKSSIFVTKASLDSAPPLCDLHSSEAGSYVVQDVMNSRTGLPEKSWTRVTVSG